MRNTDFCPNRIFRKTNFSENGAEKFKFTLQVRTKKNMRKGENFFPEKILQTFWANT
jgi:hypothetical protein